MTRLVEIPDGVWVELPNGEFAPQGLYSNTGKMTAEGAEAVKRMLSLSVESVRRSNFDLSKTYTNEFLPEP
jgi:hypothetical protein